MPRICTLVKDLWNTTPTDILRQDNLLFGCCKTVFALTVLQDLYRRIIPVEALFLVYFLDLVICKIKGVAFCHRNIWVQVKGLNSCLILLPRGFQNLCFFLLKLWLWLLLCRCKALHICHDLLHKGAWFIALKLHTDKLRVDVLKLVRLLWFFLKKVGKQPIRYRYKVIKAQSGQAMLHHILKALELRKAHDLIFN